MNLTSIFEAVTLAEKRWPGFEFKVQGDEAHGPCPICGQAKEDGFILFLNSGFFCRKGGCRGWLDDDERQVLTPDEIRLRRIEGEQNRMRVEQMKTAARVLRLEEMARCTDHLMYHNYLDEDERKWWESQGISEETQDTLALGFCYTCPTDQEHRPSHTIPVFDHTGERLLNIRHRLVGAPNGNKYRPHRAGLGRQLYRSDLVSTEKDLLLVEGCKKAIVANQHGFPTIAVYGCKGFDMRWVPHFKNVRRLLIGFDPDADKAAWDLGKELAKAIREVRVCAFPMKPDDLLIRADDSLFGQVLSQSRRVM